MSDLLKKAEKIIQKCLFVPNEILPEEYHNKKTGYVSLAKLEKKCDKRDGITDHQKLKAEKLRRVGLYREQMQSSDKIEYVDIDEHKLYNNEMRFAKYCPQINLEEEE
tara:strand:+ start:25 stop:348 length:324 start_codon:yes stop_codon:yes gene_type:complete